MAERTVYCFCDNNCKYETMDKEQILTAITNAVNSGSCGNIDAGFITTIKTVNGGYLRFFVGTQAEYDALEDKQNLFAIISNDGYKEGILNAINGIIDGTQPVGKANSAEYAQRAYQAEFTQRAEIANSAVTDGGNRQLTQSLNAGGSWTSTSITGSTVALNGGGVYLFTVYVHDIETFKTSTVVYFDGGSKTVCLLNGVVSNSAVYLYRLCINASGVASVQRAYKTDSAANDYTDLENIITSGKTTVTIGYKKLV